MKNIKKMWWIVLRRDPGHDFIVWRPWMSTTRSRLIRYLLKRRKNDGKGCI